MHNGLQKRCVLAKYVSTCTAWFVLVSAAYTGHAAFEVVGIEGTGKVAIKIAMDLAPRVVHEAHHTDRCISTQQC